MESEQQWLAGYAVAAAADIDLHVSPLGAAMIDSPNSMSCGGKYPPIIPSYCFCSIERFVVVVCEQD